MMTTMVMARRATGYGADGKADDDDNEVKQKPRV
jgi:hypothetical protein